MKPSALQSDDCNPYYKPYIDKLGDKELLETMERQLQNFPNFITNIPDEKWSYAYGEGKWTVAEVLVHVLDTERIFQYRALCIARGDDNQLPGFDQDLYVPNSNANERTKQSIIDEYKAVRASSLSLFSSFTNEMLNRKGTASGSPLSVAAAGFIIMGHQRHHRDIVRERYL